MAIACGGNIASDCGKQGYARLCESLATISKANAAAYADRYAGQTGNPCSAEEIREAAPSVCSVDIKRAVLVVQLLAYNLDNHVHDDGVASALHNVHLKMLERAVARAGWGQ